MNVLIGIILITMIAAHVVLIAYTHWRQINYKWWLTATAALSLAAVGSYFLTEDQRPLVLITLLVIAIGASGAITIDDISSRRNLSGWAGFSILWLIAVLIITITTDNAVVGKPDWIINSIKEGDASAFVMLGGLIVGWLILTGIGFYEFYKAHLPEIANRNLYWVITSSIFTLGALIIASGDELLGGLGSMVMLIALSGMVYAKSTHSVFDIRMSILTTLRYLIFLIVTAVLVFGVLYVAIRNNVTTDAEGLVFITLLSLAAVLTFIPIRQLTDFIFDNIAIRTDINPGHITREYSKLISEVVELDALIPSVLGTLNRLLKIRSSALILLNNTSDEGISVLVMSPGSAIDQRSGHISVNSSLYLLLAKERKPLTQFDIEYAARYKDISNAERNFFRDLGMSAYAPITLDFTLIGLLAVGQKLNDTAFYQRDLDLLTTLAQQTGVALRNARLVEDLQHLNKNMQSLNKKQKVANEQLSQMDAIKTDFVTIASHELRTPLAQIRGYTDIMDALNESGMLDQDQTITLIGNLRKATERMEELIAAMLDVSQLDVDAMDLRFTQSSVESVLRMAIEPLSDAIKQRKLTLSARGLRGLPAIQADQQRLVQAVRNVIVNAIKFTPDGGKIEITAALQEAQDENKPEHILIEIKDTGVGIDRANLEMIFKKFFRAYDPSLHSTGTYKFLGAGPGLGLTIARGVIEGHGGKIWAESMAHDMEAFPGSTFYILLPVSTPEDARRILSFEGTASTDAFSNDTFMKRPGQRNPTRPLEEKVEV